MVGVVSRCKWFTDSKKMHTPNYSFVALVRPPRLLTCILADEIIMDEMDDAAQYYQRQAALAHHPDASHPRSKASAHEAERITRPCLNLLL